MRSIALRSLAGNRRLAALLSLFVLASASFASTKPRYGGVLRVELLATSAILDPRAWKPGSREFATNERLAALVFDRLIALDNYGRFVPQLAGAHCGGGSLADSDHVRYRRRAEAQ